MSTHLPLNAITARSLFFSFLSCPGLLVTSKCAGFVRLPPRSDRSGLPRICGMPSPVHSAVLWKEAECGQKFSGCRFP